MGSLTGQQLATSAGSRPGWEVVHSVRDHRDRGSHAGSAGAGVAGARRRGDDSVTPGHGGDRDQTRGAPVGEIAHDSAPSATTSYVGRSGGGSLGSFGALDSPVVAVELAQPQSAATSSIEPRVIVIASPPSERRFDLFPILAIEVSPFFPRAQMRSEEGNGALPRKKRRSRFAGNWTRAPHCV
jgi:hypothetical protein